jgi:hypothetical protein
MTYTKKQLWDDALENNLAVELDTHTEEARLLFGCKLVKCRYTDAIDFYNTARGGDWYIPLTQEELDVFRSNGLKQGVYWLMMSNVTIRLKGVQDNIREQVNGDNNQRRIQMLKKYRERLIKLFNKTSNKFKQRGYVTDEIDLGSIIQD